MRTRSPKRARQERLYRQLRDAFLADNPTCQRCQAAPSTDLHHARGRVGGDLLRVEDFRALCHRCHHHVTVSPADALAAGWSLPRVGRAS